MGATIIVFPPNIMTALKQVEKDGYDGVQLGMGSKKRMKKPRVGQLKKVGVNTPVRWLKEVRFKKTSSYTEKVIEGSRPSALLDDLTLGQEVGVGQVFKKGDVVKITGTSKGRGFQGGVRRFGFSGGPKTHGQSDRHRAPGSIGSGTTPGRVFKGKHMAGHMGTNQVSYRGLEVLAVDSQSNQMVIKGGIPGPIGSLVVVENIGKLKGYTPPPEEKADEEEETKSDETTASDETATEPGAQEPVAKEAQVAENGKGEG